MKLLIHYGPRKQWSVNELILTNSRRKLQVEKELFFKENDLFGFRNLIQNQQTD